MTQFNVGAGVSMGTAQAALEGVARDGGVYSNQTSTGYTQTWGAGQAIGVFSGQGLVYDTESGAIVAGLITSGSLSVNGLTLFSFTDAAIDQVTTRAIFEAGGDSLLAEFAYWLAGNDVVSGASGDEVLFGFEGNDFLYGLGGNDVLDGGAGLDWVSYAGDRDSFTVARNEAGYTLSGGSAGFDTLISVERVQFSDSNLAFDVAGHAGDSMKFIGAVAPSLAENLSVRGLILGLLDAGQSMESLCQLAIDLDLVPDSNAALAEAVFSNVLQVPPTPEVTGALVGFIEAHGQANFLTTVAGFGLNVNLVGLAETGVEYV